MEKLKKTQYKVIDIGNRSESTEARMDKILKQIPEGKTIALTDQTFDQPSNKAIVKIIDNKDMPPPRQTKCQQCKDRPPLAQAKCQRCGHIWILRKPNPIHCPKCQSPYWNKPRRKPKQ